MPMRDMATIAMANHLTRPRAFLTSSGARPKVVLDPARAVDLTKWVAPTPSAALSSIEAAKVSGVLSLRSLPTALSIEADRRWVKEWKHVHEHLFDGVGVHVGSLWLWVRVGSQKPTPG
jgi:hypothetical protein